MTFTRPVNIDPGVDTSSIFNFGFDVLTELLTAPYVIYFLAPLGIVVVLLVGYYIASRKLIKY